MRNQHVDVNTIKAGLFVHCIYKRSWSISTFNTHANELIGEIWSRKRWRSRSRQGRSHSREKYSRVTVARPSIFLTHIGFTSLRKILRR